MSLPSSFPLLYVLSMMPHGREYSFGQSGSPVWAVSLPTSCWEDTLQPPCCQWYKKWKVPWLCVSTAQQHSCITDPVFCTNPKDSSTPAIICWSLGLLWLLFYFSSFISIISYIEMEFLKLDLIHPWKLYHC